MSNLQEVLEIRYEYPVEGYIMVDNLRVVRLHLRNEVRVLIIPLVSSV
ncbi:hypothetical protein ALC56_03892 [Trachymyrmex septentrionalis]|uniref:Uncharacterized protein n=1 Tax=Trachymyrmex septentrionalis TaxID=34720 RepID=A0A195FP79_9HYME|nr:hypothetical protein ALC56_03892 [Trachymyrmex septentrionalis]